MTLLHCKTLLMRLIFLFLLFFSGTPAWGGQAEMSIHRGKEVNFRTKKIALSLRIAEAKGKENDRTYFQSLLRQMKRKSFW